MTNDQNATEREAKIFDNYIKSRKDIPFTYQDVTNAIGVTGHQGVMDRIKRWRQSGLVRVVEGQYKKYFWKGLK